MSIKKELLQIKLFLRKRLNSDKQTPDLEGYSNEKKQLFDTIWRTVCYGESNSLLLIGPRGSGKTKLLDTVLNEMKSKTEYKEILEVYLNGLLQTDDKISINEITRQLGLENATGNRIFTSFSENLQYLLDCLKSGSKNSRPVLFLLDEFDLFAHHRNQTLLYNLFDISQTLQSPVCIIGMTARMDVTELLEKRVKSRFSHRQIQLFPQFSFEQYLHFFVSYLSIPPHRSSSLFEDNSTTGGCNNGSGNDGVNGKGGNDGGGNDEGGGNGEGGKIIERAITTVGSDSGFECAKEWNDCVQKLAKESVVEEILLKMYNLDRNIRTLQMFMLLPVCKLDEYSNGCRLDSREFINSYRLLHVNGSKTAMLQGISVLELSLIVAMDHLSKIYPDQPVNFEMVYAEYKKFCQRKCSMQCFEKPVVLKAFEHLCALEFIRPYQSSFSSGGGEGGSSGDTSARSQVVRGDTSSSSFRSRSSLELKTAREHRPVCLVLDRTELTEAIARYRNCPTDLKQWTNCSV